MKKFLVKFCKNKIFVWIKNICCFFFNFFIKNIAINVVLILITCLACGFHFYHHYFVSGCILGIVGSALASFYLIDGYKEYKIHKAQIIILSYLKSETDGLLETMIGYIVKIFKKIEKNLSESLQKDSAMNIESIAVNIWEKHNNATRKKMVNDIENLSKSIFDYCVKYSDPQDSIDFNVAIFKFEAIKKIVSSQIIIVNDECLLEAYTELILIMSQIDNKDLPENVPILLGGGKSISLISDCLYLLRNCYDKILKYKIEISNYVETRNNKHTLFFKNKL